MNAKKIIAFATGPIVSAVLGFITLPILTWLYSAEDIGRISMFQVASSFCILLFSLGLDQAYVREYHEAEDKPSLLKTSIIPGGLLLVLISISLIAYNPTLVSKLLFSLSSSVISILVLCCLIVAYVSRFLSLILRMQERGWAFSMSQILPKGLFLLVISSYIVFGTSFNFTELIAAQAFSIIAVMVIFAWNTRTMWLPAMTARMERRNLRSMLGFGLPLIFGGVASWGLTAMDRLFLRGSSTFEELGIYSIAAGVATVANIFANIFNTIWAPMVYKWTKEGINPAKLDQISEHVLAAVFFILVLAGMFSWLLRYILPNTYYAVPYLVSACMVSPLLYVLSETTTIGIGITRKTSYSMAASFIAAAINLMGNYWLVPMYGAAGAAISTAFAFWVFLVCRTEFSCLVWRKFPRFKLYSITILILTLAICMAILQQINLYIWIGAWFAMALIGLLLFKHSIGTTRIQIRQFFKKNFAL